ncbi:c-type cytochrome [Rubrimonas cliftonensis]|uniref:Cytochrome c n=1 Tax=Rubrimonas cliftonensis TaxID=89524 RepID=A0A1H4DG85_9RHOB|nr:c-type cytochrome [Rubrimonas cliftonensis]SEA71516.1 cytochrome c [Rubrimonas cliftonensis]
MLRYGVLALSLALPAAAPAPAADPERGAALFSECSGCHMVGDGARHRVGPHLNGVFGRRAAGLDGYTYSKDMIRAGADGLEWTPETLDAYIANPRALVTRTRMSYRGMKDPAERADLLAFLRGYSASPRDIPEAPPTAEPTLPAALAGVAGDRDYGEYLASECVTCHQADGSDAGIPSIVGWPEEDFKAALHGYRAKLRANQAMQLIAATLGDEEIASLATFFATHAQQPAAP